MEKHDSIIRDWIFPVRLRAGHETYSFAAVNELNEKEKKAAFEAIQICESFSLQANVLLPPDCQ